MADRYDVMTPRTGKDGKVYWTKVGVMFRSRDKDMFNIAFEAYPIPTLKDGVLEVRAVAMPPKERDGGQQGGSAPLGFRRPQPSGGPKADLDDTIPF